MVSYTPSPRSMRFARAATRVIGRELTQVSESIDGILTTDNFLKRLASDKYALSPEALDAIELYNNLHVAQRNMSTAARSVSALAQIPIPEDIDQEGATVRQVYWRVRAHLGLISRPKFQTPISTTRTHLLQALESLFALEDSGVKIETGFVNSILDAQTNVHRIQQKPILGGAVLQVSKVFHGKTYDGIINNYYEDLIRAHH